MIIISPVKKITQLSVIIFIYFFFNIVYNYFNISFLMNRILSFISLIFIIRELNYYRALIVRNHIKEVLLFTIDTLNKNKIKYWLDFGTLLGYYRDKSIILYDTDADITIDVTYGNLALITLKEACHNNTNFSFEEKDNGNGIKWFRIYNSANNIFSRKRHVDCYCVHKIKDNILLLSSKKQGDHIPCDLVYPIQKGIFYEKEVYVTNDVNSTLLYRYGSDFMKPIHMYKGRASGKYRFIFKRILNIVGFILNR